MCVGRRGTALLTFAGLDLTIAVRLATVDPKVSPFYGWLAAAVPLSIPACAWAGVAILCVVQAGQQCDRRAFQAAVTIKIVWATLWLVGWATGEVPDGWVFAAQLGAFAVCVALLAGMREERILPWTRS